jgi:hypothetical protein|tara:strand:+ start:218 stop:532 length:315 start_codon:yes stop_codon:yes gene_type:complete
LSRKNSQIHRFHGRNLKSKPATTDGWHLSQIVPQEQKVLASDGHRSTLVIRGDLDRSRNDVRVHGAVVVLAAGVAQLVPAAKIPLHVPVDANDCYLSELEKKIR